MGIPVPRPVLFHAGEELIGGPFAIAEFVPGATIQTREQLDALGDTTAAAVAQELVATLAALHSVDYEAAGLSTFGRPTGYPERQLKRWSQQWHLVGPAALTPLAAEVIRRLLAALPRQRAVSVVHGDFRIDNTILDLRAADFATAPAPAPTTTSIATSTSTATDTCATPAPSATDTCASAAAGPRVAVVVDWELSTLGDPVADVALMCAYRSPAFDLLIGTPTAWTSPRLPDTAALAASYEAAGGAPLTDWPAHLALAHFKIATIAAGIDYRQRIGAASAATTAGAAVEDFLESARAGLRSLGRNKRPIGRS